MKYESYNTKRSDIMKVIRLTSLKVCYNWQKEVCDTVGYSVEANESMERQ